MKRCSALLSEGRPAAKSEKSNAALERLYSLLCASLGLLAGLSLLVLPIHAGSRGEWAVVCAGWSLFLTTIVFALHPALFRRGIESLVLHACRCIFLVFAGWAASGLAADYILGFRMVLAAALFFTGVASVLSYGRLLPSAKLSLLLVCGFADASAALLLLFRLPDGGAPTMSRLLGMVLLLGAAESVQESHLLGRLRRPAVSGSHV